MDENHRQYILKIINQGKKKGLIVVANRFIGGWSIKLPNNTTYIAINDNDMVNYVNGY